MKYKNIYNAYFSLFILVFLFGCNNDYKQMLSNVSKIKIIAYIDENENYNRENYFVELIEKREIKNFNKFMKTRSFPITPCGFIDGWIEFYDINNNLLINSRFNFQCRQMIFNYNNTHYDIEILDEGIIYLKNIIEKIMEKIQ